MDIRKTIKELLGLSKLPTGEGLVGFTDEQLTQAKQVARDIASYAKDARNVDDLRSAVEAFEAISTELTNRAEAQAALDADIEALASKIAASDQDDDTNDDSGDGEDSGNGSDDDSSTSDSESDKTAEPVVAAAPASPATPSTPEPVIVPDPTTPASTQADAPITLVASGDVKGLSAGMEIEPSVVADAMLDKANAIQGSKTVAQYPVGRLRWEYPEDRTLKHTDPTERNMTKVNAVIAAAQDATREILDKIRWAKDPETLEALVAAGGLCAPVNVRYELFTVGTTARPLRDSLTRFGATRGGIRFNAPPTLANIREDQNGVNAVNIYTESDDTNSTGYPKGCIRVECTQDTEVTVSAITLCMEVGNYSRMFNPESFNAWWGLGRVQHARIAEAAIWARLDALSTNVSAGQGLGAAVDVLTQVERLVTQYRDRHRIDPETPLRLRAPAFLRNIMRVDLARRAPGDSTLSVSNAEIARLFANMNVAVTWVLDGQFASGTNTYTQAAAALNPWPNTVDVNIAIDGTFLFLDGGSLDFGTEIRDFTLIRNNDVAAFMETFENVAFVGPEAEMLTLDLCPDGTTSGPNSSYDPCTTGS